MGKLVYGLSASLDGFVTDGDGRIDWTAPDPETSRFVNDVQSRVGTYLFGRRMWETMRVWDDEAALTGMPDYILEYVPIWRGIDKVVVSASMPGLDAPRARLVRRLEPVGVRALVDAADADVEVGGPTLAAPLLRAGLVDEITVVQVPVVVGAGTRFLPEGLRLDLSLVDERRFASGSVFLRYAVRRSSVPTQS
ncbi:MAG TPA: dihydrofolate reductase family protein [Propionibacteriaceae bacterium]|nr:dihydrofolate reductase family protein [Propionibacteriaceae bacterium]